jgi:outer membrane protein OmpA-like peptidoglycan-associated protein
MRRVVVDLFFSIRIVPDLDLASPRDQETLKRLEQTVTGLTEYIVEVTGFADSTGSAAMNTKLSEDRARAVITFLMQRGNVPIRAYRGTWRNGRIWGKGTERDEGRAGREPSG